MEALEAILTRRSTRKFKTDNVEKEKLEEIIEAGRSAPSGGNSQTSHFFVIQNPEILEKLIQLTQDAFAKMEVTEDTYASLKTSIYLSKKGGYVFNYHAPVLIAIANQKDYGNNMADVACALENMMIAANALDLGSCYINQLKWLNEDESLLSCFREAGLQESERIYGTLALGYADTEDGMPERNPLPRKGNAVEWL